MVRSTYVINPLLPRTPLDPFFALMHITNLVDGRFAPFQACYTPKQLSDYAYNNFHGQIRSCGDALYHMPQAKSGEIVGYRYPTL